MSARLNPIAIAICDFNYNLQFWVHGGEKNGKYHIARPIMSKASNLK